jgi:hypothetical protein
VIIEGGWNLEGAGGAFPWGWRAWAGSPRRGRRATVCICCSRALRRVCRSAMGVLHGDVSFVWKHRLSSCPLRCDAPYHRASVPHVPRLDKKIPHLPIALQGKRVKIPWLIVAFDTLLKIASLFSCAVVRGTHELLLAKSGKRGIHVWWTVENLVFQHTGGRKNDFASSLHDRWSPPRMNMWYNSGRAAGSEVVFDSGALSLTSRRTQIPAGTAHCRL